MSADRLNKLRTLLDRVKTNRALPRSQPVLAAARPTLDTVEDESLEDDVLSDDDIVELDPRLSDAPPPVEDIDSAEEAPPRSSQRAIAGGFDQVLDDADEDPAPKTPPPESGPERVPMPAIAEVSRSPELDSVGTPGEFEAHALHEGLPTSAQLGNTVALEEGAPADIEIDTTTPPSERPVASEELEMELPPRLASGSFDASLAPPPEAQEELRQHREREAQPVVLPEPEEEAVAAALVAQEAPALASVPTPVSTAESAAPAPSAPSHARFQRPTLSPSEMVLSGTERTLSPPTFLALLDASLELE